MRDWANWALDTAAARGATYADVRVLDAASATSPSYGLEIFRKCLAVAFFVFGMAFCVSLKAKALTTETVRPLKFTSVTAGNAHTCGLTEEGEIYCWGSNKEGQLGIGSADDATHPKPLRILGGPKFQSVDANGRHTCGLTASGVGYCWGFNEYGQLGNGTLVSTAAPVLVSGKLIFKSLSAGATHTCGITTAGAAYCWGGNWHGQLDMGTMDGEERYPCCHTSPVRVTGELSFSSIGAGGIHTCGLTTSGKAYCWGNTKNFGQLGTGDADLRDRPLPVPVAGGHKFVSISAGLPSCGIIPSGVAYCWGGGPVPELGIKSSVDRLDRPILLSSDITFESIAPGAFFACGIASGGVLYCWGYNRYGQVGDGSTENSDVPKPIAPGLKFTMVTAGGNEFSGHTCGITTDSRTLCWGDNRQGQLGDGSSVQKLRPVVVTQPAEE